MIFEESLTFDDVLLKPVPLSHIKSRAEVDTSTVLCGKKYNMGILSANMDTVYSPQLAQEVARMGGVSVVHRFCSIEDNIKLFKQGIYNDIKPWVAVGLGGIELERCIGLIEAGAEVVVVDVANGASMQVIEQFRAIRDHFKDNVAIVVGNFATKEQINTFSDYCRSVNLFKISVGSGSACSTSIVTGVGVRSFSCLKDCLYSGKDVIFDGGIKNSGDYCKAMALGAKGIMMGKNFAATLENPGKLYLKILSKLTNKVEFLTEEEYANCNDVELIDNNFYKKYRGSASLESYEVQGKVASHRTPEGETFFVELTGKVEDLMTNYNAALRSSMSYLNAKNLEEFSWNSRFVKVTQNGRMESQPHGKTNNS